MKRHLLLIAMLALLAAAPVPAQSRFFVGATGGISRTSTSGDLPQDGSSTSKVGYSAEFIGEVAPGLDVSYVLVPARDLPEKQGFLTATIDVRLYF